MGKIKTLCTRCKREFEVDDTPVSDMWLENKHEEVLCPDCIEDMEL